MDVQELLLEGEFWETLTKAKENPLHVEMARAQQIMKVDLESKEVIQGLALIEWWALNALFLQPLPICEIIATTMHYTCNHLYL